MELINSFQTHQEKKKTIKKRLIHSLPYINKSKNYHSKNNLFSEIASLSNQKINVNKKRHDFIGIIITEEEYLHTKTEILSIINTFSETDLLNILSIKQFNSNFKFIFESFLFLLNFPFFDWNSFKNSINIYSLKHKMGNFNFSFIDSMKINLFLNKLYIKNDNLEEYFNVNLTDKPYKESYLIENSHNNNDKDIIKSIYKVYMFIKYGFKEYMYWYQNKKNRTIDKKEINNEYNDKEKDNNKNIKLSHNYSHDQTKPIKNFKELLITSIHNTNNTEPYMFDKSYLSFKSDNLLVNDESIKVKTSNKLKTSLQIKDKVLDLNEINMKETITKNKEKSLLKIPLIENKTFPQLRRYYEQVFKGNVLEKSVIKELNNASIQFPQSKDKFFQIIESGKIKAVKDKNFYAILYNLYKK